MARKDVAQKETYSVRLQPQVIDTLRHLAVDQHKPLSGLLEEAILDLLHKYGRTLPAEGKRGRAKKPSRR
jgi:hypothetical protein